jgi:hypothetical protein
MAISAEPHGRETPQRFPHRLERDPSLAAEVRQAVIYALVPLFLVALGMFGWAQRDPPPALSDLPLWVPVAAAGLLLATLGFLGNVAVKANRAIRGIAPLVEIETLPLRPGQSSGIRIYDPAPRAVEKLEAYLIAEAIRVERVPLTTASDAGWRFTEFVRAQQQLLSATAEELRQSPVFDRVARLTVPLEAADHAWRWQILIVASRSRGIPREDRYPVPVATEAGPVTVLEIADSGRVG